MNPSFSLVVLQHVLSNVEVRTRIKRQLVKELDVELEDHHRDQEHDFERRAWWSEDYSGDDQDGDQCVLDARRQDRRDQDYDHDDDQRRRHRGRSSQGRGPCAGDGRRGHLEGTRTVRPAHRRRREPYARRRRAQRVRQVQQVARGLAVRLPTVALCHTSYSNLMYVVQ